MFPFNVRVYGICIRNNEFVLVSDEKYNDFIFTKFTGGGLEFGEGTIECLEREWREELNLQIEVLSHFYTTDFFQASKFDAKQQVISIYYLIQLKEEIDFPILEHAQQLDANEKEQQKQRWIPLAKLNTDQFVLPIDKVVVQKLIEKYRTM
jgi:8-oxo-dGTP diphosphatase